MDDKDVQKHYKRYEIYVGTETLIDSFLTLTTKALGMVVRLKDAAALPNEFKTELKNDYIKERLVLRCGWMLAFANAALTTTKHIDFNATEQIASVAAEQSSATAE